jgi:hypothetical protein
MREEQMAEIAVNDGGTSASTDTRLTRAVSPSVLRKQLATLAPVYECADAYNRAALEPVIRKALARAEEV